MLLLESITGFFNLEINVKNKFVDPYKVINTYEIKQNALSFLLLHTINCEYSFPILRLWL